MTIKTQKSEKLEKLEYVFSLKKMKLQSEETFCKRGKTMNCNPNKG